MEVKPQNSNELIKLGQLIQDISVAMLTSLDDLHEFKTELISRPMTPLEMCEQGAVWFLTDSNSNKLKDLEKLNLGFSDEPNGTFVSISGHGEIIEDRARIQSLWTPFARPWFPDGVNSSNLVALKFIPHSAEFWDAPNSKMVRVLATVTSIAVAKPIGMGEHGNLNSL